MIREDIFMSNSGLHVHTHAEVSMPICMHVIYTCIQYIQLHTIHTTIITTIMKGKTIFKSQCSSH